jgi:hypothetical protein
MRYKRFTLVLTPRNTHNITRITELEDCSKAEAVRRALERYRRAVEERDAAEKTKAAALQAGAA